MHLTWKWLKLVALSSLAMGMAPGVTIQLEQGGWAYGGPLTVTFTGTDANADGQLAQIELTAFSAVYALPGGGSTTWTLGDLHSDGFLFSDLGNFLFFASNNSYTLIDSALEAVVTASVVNQFLFPVDTTDAMPTAVPEPSGTALVGLSLIVALLKLNRRRHV